MIAAFGSADEEGAAFAVGEGGTENVGAGFGAVGGDFVEDEEIDAVAVKGVGVESAADDQGGPEGDVDGEICGREAVRRWGRVRGGR